MTRLAATGSLGLVVAVAAAGLAAPAAVAAPIVIRDEMISDPAITPALGRGYSIATNTFQSICLAEIVKTKPSYNFTYSFEELDALASKADVVIDKPGGSTDVTKDIKLDVSGTATYTDTTGKRWFRHYLQVSIKIDVYYASIDESKGKLADAPLKLLTANDVPGFFDACGIYYTRSINRRSSYLSLFSYETENAARDSAFETAMKNQITKFGGDPPPSPPPPGTATFDQQVSTRKTTIRSYGFGLGKDERAELIAYDIATFKAAVKSALLTMQNDDVGIVTSIEVVPWVENAQFQSNLALGPKEIDGATPTAPKITVSPYVQKRILSANSEFLVEVDRSARARLVNYYRAKMCRMTIERSYARRGSDGSYDLADNATRPIINNRTNTDPMPLSKLFTEELAEARITALHDEYDAFTYKAAQACLDQLLTTSFTLKSYRTMPTCAGLETQLAVVSGRVIEDYCMPTFAPKQSGTTP